MLLRACIAPGPRVIYQQHFERARGRRQFLTRNSLSLEQACSPCTCPPWRHTIRSGRACRLHCSLCRHTRARTRAFVRREETISIMHSLPLQQIGPAIQAALNYVAQVESMIVRQKVRTRRQRPWLSGPKDRNSLRHFMHAERPFAPLRCSPACPISPQRT